MRTTSAIRKYKTLEKTLHQLALEGHPFQIPENSYVVTACSQGLNRSMMTLSALQDRYGSKVKFCGTLGCSEQLEPGSMMAAAFNEDKTINHRGLGTEGDDLPDGEPRLLVLLKNPTLRTAKLEDQREKWVFNSDDYPQFRRVSRIGEKDHEGEEVSCKLIIEEIAKQINEAGDKGFYFISSATDHEYEKIIALMNLFDKIKRHKISGELALRSTIPEVEQEEYEDIKTQYVTIAKLDNRFGDYIKGLKECPITENVRALYMLKYKLEINQMLHGTRDLQNQILVQRVKDFQRQIQGYQETLRLIFPEAFEEGGCCDQNENGDKIRSRAVDDATFGIVKYKLQYKEGISGEENAEYVSICKFDARGNVIEASSDRAVIDKVIAIARAKSIAIPDGFPVLGNILSAAEAPRETAHSSAELARMAAGGGAETPLAPVAVLHSVFEGLRNLSSGSVAAAACPASSLAASVPNTECLPIENSRFIDSYIAKGGETIFSLNSGDKEKAMGFDSDGAQKTHLYSVSSNENADRILKQEQKSIAKLVGQKITKLLSGEEELQGYSDTNSIKIFRGLYQLNEGDSRRSVNDAIVKIAQITHEIAVTNNGFSNDKSKKHKILGEIQEKINSDPITMSESRLSSEEVFKIGALISIEFQKMAKELNRYSGRINSRVGDDGKPVGFRLKRSDGSVVIDGLRSGLEGNSLERG